MVCIDDVMRTDVALTGTCDEPAVIKASELETVETPPAGPPGHGLPGFWDDPVVTLRNEEEEEEDDDFEYFDDEDEEDDELDEEDEFEEDDFDDEEEEDEEEEDEDF